MSNDIRPQIESANGKLMEAFKRGDAPAIAHLYTSEAQLLPAHSDVVRGPAAIRTFWQALIDTGLKEATVETAEMEAYGETAIEVGRYRLFAAGGAMADQGKYIVVWKNDRGTWKLHRDIWTTSQPAAASDAGRSSA